jgi:hypothetical protein
MQGTDIYRRCDTTGFLGSGGGRGQGLGVRVLGGYYEV